MRTSSTYLRLLRLGHSVQESAFKLGAIGGAVVALSGCAIVVLQIYLWLRYGEWKELPLLNVLSYFPWNHTALNGHMTVFDKVIVWFISPSEWLGLHKMVTHILDTPASLILIISGVAILIGFAAKVSELQNEHRDALYRRLGFTNAFSFQGPLITGYSLTTKSNDARSPIYSLFIEEVDTKSVCLTVSLADASYTGGSWAPLTVRVPMRLYELVPITESHISAPSQNVNTLPASNPIPGLYIALVNRSRDAYHRRTVTYLAGVHPGIL